MKVTRTIALTIIITMIIILHQVRIMATDLLMVKVVTDNLEVSHNETEAKDLNIININFREAHFNRTVLNMAPATNPIFMEIKQIATEAEAVAGSPKQFKGCGCGRANYQSNNGTYQY